MEDTASVIEVSETTARLRRDGAPLYLQIAEQLAHRIEDGTFAVGDRFPPEPRLAETFGVSRLTLRHALTVLERRGLIDRVVGRRGGTFVRSRPLNRDLTTFAGYSEQLRRQGLVAGAEVLRAEEVAASPVVADALEIDEGAPVFEVQRLRLASGAPVALECSSFPAVAFPGLLEGPLDGSLYAVLGERYGRRPTHGLEALEPVEADRHSARLLRVPPGTAVLLVERTAFDVDGAPVEYARDLYRGDRARVVVWSFEVPPH